MGPEVQELEEELTEFTGAPYAVSCSSGTDALLMALLALDVRPGDVVLTTPFTFVATAEVLPMLGALPAFVDINPDTFNIDPNSLEQAISTLRKEGANLKGIIPVDLFGLLAEYDPIQEIADANNLFVLQDAAQSFGASFRGKRACSNAEIAATSFFPAKPLGCYGDAGAVFCRTEEHYNMLQSVRVHGQGEHKYENVRIGMNGRCDTMQAAILLEKLTIFEEEVELRNKVAARYVEALKPKYRLQQIPEGNISAWAQFSIITEARDKKLEQLKKRSIPTAIYYPKPLHKQGAFERMKLTPVSLEHSEWAAERIFSVPMHPYLSEQDQDQIIEALLEN